MPPNALEILSDALRRDDSTCIVMADDIAHKAQQARAQPRRARGFQVVKDWDGTGITHDRRWHGGRSKN